MNNLNFSAGPAVLPAGVKEAVAQELLQGSIHGFSVAEIGHRTAEIEQLFTLTEKNIRELLKISQEYAVIFTQGGARAIFSALPLNFANKRHRADYCVTGHWSQMAAIEARKFVQLARDIEITTPDTSTFDDVDYVHFTDNETLEGNIYGSIPIHTAPIMVDMTSSLFTREINVNDYDLIYAAAQKNFGVAGATLVIVKKALLGNAKHTTPAILNLTDIYNSGSMLNTPPVHAIYWMYNMTNWLLESGGVSAINKKCTHNSQQVYDVVDQFDIYSSLVPKHLRSITNVVFFTNDDKKFLEQADNHGLKYLRGHKLVGGVRASMYAGMRDDAGAKLAEFMRDYAHSSQ